MWHNDMEWDSMWSMRNHGRRISWWRDTARRMAAEARHKRTIIDRWMRAWSEMRDQRTAAQELLAEGLLCGTSGPDREIWKAKVVTYMEATP